MGSVFPAPGSRFRILPSLVILGNGLVAAVLVLPLFAILTICPEIVLFFDRSPQSKAAPHKSDVPDELKELIGTKGTTTPMRPAGSVRIAGIIHEATTEGGFLDRNSPVIVVGVADRRIMITPNRATDR